MPYELKWESNGVHAIFWGVFCVKDNTDATVELYTAPQFEKLQYIIWDFSDVSKMNMSTGDTDVAAGYDKVASYRLPHTKVALIAKDEFTKELCNQYIAQCQNRHLGWEFMLSDSMESIRAWVS